jgi:hypothetical protein
MSNLHHVTLVREKMKVAGEDEIRAFFGYGR